LWVVGIDEAGYGPSVGPLVVAAVAAEGSLGQVSDRLRRLPIPIGDSKRIYRGDIAPLERAVLGLFDSVPESAAVLLESLCEEMPLRPFYWRNLALPLSEVHCEPLKLAFSGAESAVFSTGHARLRKDRSLSSATDSVRGKTMPLFCNSSSHL